MRKENLLRKRYLNRPDPLSTELAIRPAVHRAITQVANGLYALAGDQLRQALDDGRGQAGAFIDHAGIELHEIGPCPHLFQSGLRR